MSISKLRRKYNWKLAKTAFLNNLRYKDTGRVPKTKNTYPKQVAKTAWTEAKKWWRNQTKPGQLRFHFQLDCKTKRWDSRMSRFSHRELLGSDDIIMLEVLSVPMVKVRIFHVTETLIHIILNEENIIKTSIEPFPSPTVYTLYFKRK